ncbi:MAG: hypothetical protein Q4F70_00355 [Clostridia bacterium]|nr:hypothetical protein [Clostridia bacterium]
MFEHKNLYPVILVPGVIGYGEETLVHKVVPYFGLTSTSYEKVIKDMGMDCHTATFELLSSVWDRTCELYAQIVGGTVDYGKAHSEKYGHARYGKTYKKPMIESWDKITLIAHGFGAPVARLFIELLNNGSAEETSATPSNELSDLFKGGFYNKIHALVTIAGINDGISTAEALEGRFPGAKKVLAKAATVADVALKFKGYVDPYEQGRGISVSQHNLSAHLEEVDGKSKVKFDENAIDSYLSKEDNIFYDMGPWGMQKLNSKLGTFNNIYYFSLSGEVTSNLMDKVTLPKLSAGLTLPTTVLISTFENYLPEFPIITKRDQDNDGLVNTNAQMPPINEEASAFKDISRCQPGIWYQMPVESRNHFSFMGLFVRPDKYRNEIFDLMKVICNLE